MKPSLLNLFSALSVLLLIAVSQPGAQTPQRDNRPRTASINGRVTIGGAPAANSFVVVMEVDPRSRDASIGADSQQRALVKVRTDNDGRYLVTGLTEGSYMISALSKAYAPARNSSELGAFRSITLDDGESRDNVDIALVRGGVITGRVVDAEGRPLIASHVRLLSVDENGKPRGEFSFDNWSMGQTDDRGVYRIYGLPAGRYIIGAGGESAYGSAKRKYPETFHSDATDLSQAKIIEVKEGVEVAEIDIRLGAGKNTYEAAGRVVDAESGQPLPHSMVMCLEAPDNENNGRRYGGEAITDEKGRFRVAGLSSGRYDLILRNRMYWFGSPSASMGNNEHYSERIRFVVSDSDVSGLEIKAIRGSTISGVVVIEGVNDPAVKTKLQQMSVAINVADKSESAGNGRAYEGRTSVSAKVANDGGFRLTGAPPGMASFYIGGFRENIFSIKRIERNGAEIRSAIEINRGEQIAGVRIVVSYANGTIRGQVEIVGGRLPDGWQLQIHAVPIRTTTGDERYQAFYSSGGNATADEKGRFVMEWLVPGEYELMLSALVRVNQYDWNSVPGSEVKQRVTVIGDAVTPVNLTLNPARK